MIPSKKSKGPEIDLGIREGEGKWEWSSYPNVRWGSRSYATRYAPVTLASFSPFSRCWVESDPEDFVLSACLNCLETQVFMVGELATLMQIADPVLMPILVMETWKPIQSSEKLQALACVIPRPGWLWHRERVQEPRACSFAEICT